MSQFGEPGFYIDRDESRGGITMWVDGCMGLLNKYCALRKQGVPQKDAQIWVNWWWGEHRHEYSEARHAD